MMYAKRVLALMAALAILGCASADLPRKDDWVVLGGDGTPPEIVLVRERLPSQAVRARYPVLLRITWMYDGLPNGLPTYEESERGMQLYAALEKIFAGRGVYAMSRTVAGARSIYYYVEQPTAHSEQLRRYFDAHPDLAVTITARGEPGWDSVRKVLDGIRK